MNEWAIIKQRMITFWCVVVAAGGATLSSGFVFLADKFPQYAVAFHITAIVLNSAVTAAVAIRAWFSTSVQNAREEIKAENGAEKT